MGRGGAFHTKNIEKWYFIRQEAKRKWRFKNEKRAWAK